MYYHPLAKMKGKIGLVFLGVALGAMGVLAWMSVSSSSRSSHDPSGSRQLFITSGQAKLGLQDFKGAIEDFDEAIRSDPKQWDAYHLRGVARQGLGDFEKALEDLKLAIERLPAAPDRASGALFNNYGYSKLRLGDFHGAYEAFSRAITLDPKVATYFAGRAQVCEKLGNWNGAAQDYAHVLECLAPSDPSRTNVALSLEAAKQRAREVATGASTPGPTIPELTSGDAKFDAGDFQGALHDYEAAIRIDGQNWTSYLGRGNARNSLGDWRGAVQDFDRAIALNPVWPKSYNNRGVAKARLGDRQGAIADLSKAIELDPGYAESFYSRAQVFGELGDWEKAVADWTELLRLLGPTDQRRSTITILLEDAKKRSGANKKKY
jgi:tetratricopeptide (TPR) repeat protein